MIYGNVNNEFFERQVAILPKPLGDALRFLKTADLVIADFCCISLTTSIAVVADRRA